MKKDFFKKTVLALAEESKCVSRQVGAIIVRENRIISTGYNGTISGAPNCNELHDPENFDRDKHHAWSKVNELHAEQNAILMAAKHGIEINGADLYTSLQPCSTCLLMSAQAGIKNIYYVREYDRSGYDQDLIDQVERIGCKLIKLN